MTFQLTEHELGSLASDLGFLKNSVEKVLRLVNVLKDLERNSVTKGKFVLKGGTAINLFYLNLPRISVDIDVNYIGFLPKQDMTEDRKRIKLEILKIFAGEYKLDELMDEHALLQLKFGYRTLSGSSDALRLEINYLLRQPIIKPVLKRLKGFKEEFWFPCLDEIEIFASKTIACLSRYSPRDLYDLYGWIRSSSNINNSSFRYLLTYFALIRKTSIFDLYELNFDSITDKEIRDHLLPMLQRRSNPQRKEMIQNVQDFLKPLITLTDDEEREIKNFYATGELNTEFLFPDKKMRQNIIQSPAMVWKMKNIKQHVS